MPERLLISSNWRWYLLQRIVYCSHITLFSDFEIGGPGCSPVSCPYQPLVLPSEENTINATIQQFISAKISGCTLKQGSITHSSLRQSNLPLQNQAALMSCRIRAVEHRKYTRIENAHKVRTKTFNSCYV